MTSYFIFCFSPLLRRASVWGAAVAACCLAVVALAAPAHVLVRVPAGKPPPAELASLLAKWRQSGEVSQILFLTQGKGEKRGAGAKFESLAVLEFADNNACERWQREAAPSLPGGLIVRRADLVLHRELEPHDSSRPFFLVNSYTPTVPAVRYVDFVRGYIKPLYEAMQGTGHLVSYSIFLERGEMGRVDALSVLEYRDSTAFAAMVPLKKGIRASLAATNPVYASYDKTKDGLRLDVGGTLATYTELPSPRAGDLR